MYRCTQCKVVTLHKSNTPAVSPIFLILARPPSVLSLLHSLGLCTKGCQMQCCIASNPSNPCCYFLSNSVVYADPWSVTRGWLTQNFKKKVKNMRSHTEWNHVKSSPTCFSSPSCRISTVSLDWPRVPLTSVCSRHKRICQLAPNSEFHKWYSSKSYELVWIRLNKSTQP